MAFNTEDKITLNDLAPSLQDLLTRAVKKSEITALQTRVNSLKSLLKDMRFSIVNSFDEVSNPVNNKEIVIKNENNEYKMFVYVGGEWKRVPLSTAVNANLTYIVTIKQSPNQIISANYNSSQYTSNFRVQAGSTITFNISASKGYIAGNLNLSSPQIISKNITVFASPATELPKYNVIVNTSLGQYITVSYNNVSYKNKSISGIYKGDIVSITLNAEEGFNVGTLSINGDYIAESRPNTYIVNGDITVTTTPAIRNNYNIYIPPTTNQTITVNYTNSTTGESGTITSSEISKSIRLPYESVYTVTVTAIDGYNAGKLSTNGGVLKGNINISISNATRKTYSVKLPITNNQTINFSYIDFITGSNVEFSSKSNTDVIINNIPVESTYSVTVSATTGYNPGTLNIPSSGTITGNLSITVTDITPKNYTLTILQVENQTIKAELPNGTFITETTSLPYDQLFTSVITANEGYNAGTTKVTGDFEQLSSTQYRVKGNLILSANNVTPKKYALNIIQQDYQTIKVKLLPQNTYVTVTSLIDYNQEFSIEVIPNTGYDAGTISISGNFETISTNRYRNKIGCTINVSPATRTGVTITIPKTTNQVLKVNYTNPNTNLVNIISSSKSTNVSEIVPYNSRFTTLVIADEGYIAGSVTPVSGTFENNVIFNVSAATLN